MIQLMIDIELGEGQVGNAGDTIGTAIAESQVGVGGSVYGELAVGEQTWRSV